MSLESAIISSIRVSPRTKCSNVTCPAAREKNNNSPATGPAVTKQSKQKRTAKMILQLRALGYRIENTKSSTEPSTSAVIFDSEIAKASEIEPNAVSARTCVESRCGAAV